MIGKCTCIIIYVMPSFFTVVPPIDIHIRKPEEMKKKFKPKHLHHIRGHDGEKEASCCERKHISRIMDQRIFAGVDNSPNDA